MSAQPQVDWIEANQRYLAAEFARLRALLAGGDLGIAAAQLDQMRAEMPAPSALDHLSEMFGLTAFERDVLLLCAGAEIDSAVAAQLAATVNERGSSLLTFGLALSMLPDPHWTAITPARPLRRWCLIELGDGPSLLTKRLGIDERVLHFLAGTSYLDPRLRPLMREQPMPELASPSHLALAQTALRELERHGRPVPLVELVGDDLTGKRGVAGLIARALGLQLHMLQAADIPDGVQERDALSVLWEREAALLASGLLIEHDGDVGKALRLAERPGGLVFIASRHPGSAPRASLRLTVDKPEASEQKRLWTEALGPEVARLNGALDRVATHFRLSADAIARISDAVRVRRADMPSADAVLWHECRSLVRTGLNGLAQRVEPAATWDAVILPEPQKATLRQIAAHMKHRLEVYDTWGFAKRDTRGLGITALFAGESGTGKTMATEALARELCLDLYRIDLSVVVSKYIGETEKNLSRVFDAAEESGAILLFDEADALFGKRSDVKDSHDRYANIEVSYLLQRMEAYRGLAILTTNLKSALDAAFHRRLRFVVHFPFPDEPLREAIWRGVFPPATPVEALDFAKLSKLAVAGGGIRNIALNAAFLAVGAGQPVSMAHLLQAARTEGGKRERPLSDAEIRGWV